MLSIEKIDLLAVLRHLKLWLCVKFNETLQT